MSKTTRHRDYFSWLTAQIAIPEKNPHTYRGVFIRMHETEFVWIVPHDDNRVADGRHLRSEFLHGWKDKPRPVSVLEVLIALSRRVAFNAGGRPEEWAWVLLENLRLHKVWDPLDTKNKIEKVDQILHNLIWRTYERNGTGGFFPLQDPQEDQTKVEIWFQMQAYTMEIEGI